MNRAATFAPLRMFLVYSALLMLSALFIVPLLWMLSVSLHDAQGVFAQPFEWLPAEPRWVNYSDALSAIPFGRYLLNTTIITGSVLFLTLLSCSLGAYGFARLRFYGRDALFAVCLSTMMLPGQAEMTGVVSSLTVTVNWQVF